MDASRHPSLAMIVYAGLVGGLAEVLWFLIYAAATGFDNTALARNIAWTVIPSLKLSSAASVGLLIHFTLSVALAMLFVSVWRAMPAAIRRPRAVIGVATIALGCVWAFNFFIVLPAVNPHFIAATPYGAALISKLAFGVAMGFVLALALKPRTVRAARKLAY